MNKIFKRITASIMAISTLAVSMVGISANAAYPTSVNWNIHWSPYDSNSPQTKTLVSYGNGYNATMTSKAGTCSLNYVEISAPNMTKKSISELNKDVYMHPTLSGSDSITFTIVIVHDGGNSASCSGTIRTA